MADEQPNPAASESPQSWPDPATSPLLEPTAVHEPALVEAPEEPAPFAPTEPTAPAGAPPVTVDQFTRRDDEDALEGSLVTIIDGEHSGQNAAFVNTVEHDHDNGYPKLILVRFQSASYDYEYAVVAYKNVRPAAHPGHQ